MFIEENGELTGKVTEGAGETLERVYHETVMKVTENFEALRFNTGISQLMVFINEAYKANELPREYIEGFVKLLSPIAPHLAEELWEKLTKVRLHTRLDAYDESKLVDDEVEIVVQLNGKVKAKLMVPADADKAALEQLAQADEKVKEQLEGKTIRKIIAVPGKLVNIVAN